MLTLLSQGAEARVYKGTFFGAVAVVKERFAKKYRHPALDRKLSAHRMTMEVRSMLRAAQAGALRRRCCSWTNRSSASSWNSSTACR